MGIKSQVEIENMNFPEREQAQNHKEKKEASAKTQKIEGQPHHAFRVCKGEDISSGDQNSSGDIGFKSLNGNISSVLCTEHGNPSQRCASCPQERRDSGISSCDFTGTL